MNFKVGVFAVGELSGEVVNETKKALNEIALKYNCRFELKESNQTQGTTGKTAISDQLDAKNQSGKNSGLSFGGQIDV